MLDLLFFFSAPCVVSTNPTAAGSTRNLSNTFRALAVDFQGKGSATLSNNNLDSKARNVPSIPIIWNSFVLLAYASILICANLGHSPCALFFAPRGSKLKADWQCGKRSIESKAMTEILSSCHAEVFVPRALLRGQGLNRASNLDEGVCQLLCSGGVWWAYAKCKKVAQTDVQIN